MNRARSIAAFILLFAAAAAARAQAPKAYSWEVAHEHKGEKAAVTGTIVAAKNTGKLCFLNFNEDFRTYVSVVIYAEDFAKFGGAPEKAYQGRKVRVTGEISDYQGRAQIVVKDAAQIEILDGAAPAAASAPAAAPMPAAAAPASAAASAGVLPWEEAEKKVGAEVTTEGKIVGTKNIGGTAYMSFHATDRARLAIVVRQADASKFLAPPEQLYQGMRVRVHGKVTEAQGQKQIVVTDPAQIEVVPDKAAARASAPSGPMPALAAPASSGAPVAVIPWNKAGDYIGQTVTVEGKVIRAHVSRTGTLFLTFNEDWKSTLNVAIFADNLGKFPAAPDQHFMNKKIRATGKLKTYQGHPDMTIDSPDQIQIVE